MGPWLKKHNSFCWAASTPCTYTACLPRRISAQLGSVHHLLPQVSCMLSYTPDSEAKMVREAVCRATTAFSLKPQEAWRRGLGWENWYSSSFSLLPALEFLSSTQVLTIFTARTPPCWKLLPWISQMSHAAPFLSLSPLLHVLSKLDISWGKMRDAVCKRCQLLATCISEGFICSLHEQQLLQPQPLSSHHHNYRLCQPPTAGLTTD